jgi:hypothetical protein
MRGISRRRWARIALLAVAVCGQVGAVDGHDKPGSEQDPHYTAAGFFDIHVCNWPDRPPFYLSLFSTSRYAEVRQVEVHYPDGHVLTRIGLDHYRILHPKGKPEKHVFMKQVVIPPEAPDGWYVADITLSNGDRLSARDYVHIAKLPRAHGMNPPDGAEDIATPRALSWKRVKGAGYYEVFIRDLWDDNRLIYTSKLLNEPRLELPAGLIRPGGLYSWVVHARDIDRDIRLGDFNRGSMNRPATFSVRP